MNNHKFIISTDSSADYFKGFYKEQNIYCIVMKRILNGNEISELYGSVQEFDNFYNELKKGALPTTTQLNFYELSEYFKSILQKEPSGDIIHLALSSGLSGSCDNAKASAEEINKELVGRKIYVIDSLIATGGIAMLIDRLIKLRNLGIETKKAIEEINDLKNRQQGFVIMSDLFHLKRGGRISGAKAAIGTLLNIRPIIVINDKGRLEIENSVRGDRKSVDYLIKKTEQLTIVQDSDVYLLRTSFSEKYNLLKQALINKYPNLVIKESIVGPIIGTHLGCGGVILLYESKLPRLKEKT